MRATPETLDGVVRVGLHRSFGAHALSIRLDGRAEVWDLALSRRLGTAGPGMVEVERDAARVACPALPYTSTLGLRFVLPSGGAFRFAGHAYPGALEVWADGNSLTAVNEVDLEDYVLGALAVEGSSGMAPESLKALAVAIRTYSLSSRGKHDGGLFDVCDTSHCQGYLGGPSGGDAWVRRAEDATRGIVLMWRDRPIWALYSTDCGGSTANNEDGGQGETPLPYLRAVSAADGRGRDYCAASPFHHWVYTISIGALEALLNRDARTRVGSLVDLSVAKTDRFGRAVTLQAVAAPFLSGRSSSRRLSGRQALLSTRGGSVRRAAARYRARVGQSEVRPDRRSESVALRATTLRSLLGENALKSTRFTIERVGDILRFTGSGYGHGVGMCLFGASGMARAGARYPDILYHYYTGASLIQLYGPLKP